MSEPILNPLEDTADISTNEESFNFEYVDNGKNARKMPYCFLRDVKFIVPEFIAKDFSLGKPTQVRVMYDKGKKVMAFVFGDGKFDINKPGAMPVSINKKGDLSFNIRSFLKSEGIEPSNVKHFMHFVECKNPDISFCVDLGKRWTVNAKKKLGSK